MRHITQFTAGLIALTFTTNIARADISVLGWDGDFLPRKLRAVARCCRARKYWNHR